MPTVDSDVLVIGRHAWITTDHRRPVSALDLAGHGRFTVLTGIGGSGWERAAAAVADRLRIDVAARYPGAMPGVHAEAALESAPRPVLDRAETPVGAQS
jgi:hypothetical protein